MANDEEDDKDKSESFEAYDPLLEERGISNPWQTADDGRRIYVPDLDLLRDMVAIPVGKGQARQQQSGRVAKAFDAWIAHEFRRAGFPAEAVWPRAKQPRVLPGDLAGFEAQLAKALGLLRDHEIRQKDSGGPMYLKPTDFRHAVKKLEGMLPGSGAANILGRFYVKQVDVVISAWQRGPDVLVSTKTAFSSYLNNKNNRYEEAVGEATNLRERHPMAAMGFAFLVRTNIHSGKEKGAYAYLRDLLIRLRRPDGPFDATMLLAAEWDDHEIVSGVENAADDLTAARFFEDMIRTVTTSTPVTVHTDLRLRRDGEPTGGLPDDDDEDAVG